MPGMSRTNGRLIDDLAHLRQSIADILTTPIGSRVMRREYGSRLFSLVDAPINARTLGDVYAATVDALRRWEPRIAVRQVRVLQAAAGRLELALTADYRDGAQRQRINLQVEVSA
ncbi:MAG: GPW/gp25 family protein [Xanthomonadaceae bacterium]|nr:GPW/gp25 family protein [Xanthomonadaceae bacterium]